MTITLFQDKNFRDRSMVVTANMADLKDVSIGANPSSIRLTGSGEAILLYTQRDWDGDVHYVRGPASVADLGSAVPAASSASATTSARCVRPRSGCDSTSTSPATSPVSPAQWAPGTQQARVESIVGRANELLTGQRALLRLEIAGRRCARPTRSTTCR